MKNQTRKVSAPEFSYPAICGAAEEVVNEGRALIIGSRPLFVSGAISFADWMCRCATVRVRNIMANRAMDMAAEPCGWLIASALKGGAK